jgi:N-acyl-D-amino-acid deacylase
MTSLPATILNINKRGLIEEGFYADITIFDPNSVIDKATFMDPHQYAVGVNTVIVNGSIVVQDGVHTGARPGRILHGPGYK